MGTSVNNSPIRDDNESNLQFSIFNLQSYRPAPTTSKEDLKRGATNVAVVETGLPTCLLHFFFFFVWLIHFLYIFARSFGKYWNFQPPPLSQWGDWWSLRPTLLLTSHFQSGLNDVATQKYDNLTIQIWKDYFSASWQWRACWCCRHKAFMISR